MSPDPPSPVPSSALNIPVERRSHCRYEMALEVRCKPRASSEILIGKTCDLSSRGLRFQVEKTFLPGEMLQLYIRWPFLLNDVCPLQLVILGHVIRSDQSGTVIAVTHHEFRTLGTAATAQPGHGRVSMVA
jgi:hypothetical protein